MNVGYIERLATRDVADGWAALLADFASRHYSLQTGQSLPRAYKLKAAKWQQFCNIALDVIVIRLVIIMHITRNCSTLNNPSLLWHPRYFSPRDFVLCWFCLHLPCTFCLPEEISRILSGTWNTRGIDWSRRDSTRKMRTRNRIM